MVNKTKKHIILTFTIILIAVFISGILLGKTIGSSGLTKVNRLIKESELNTESYLVKQSLIKSMNNDICSFSKTRLAEMNKELGSIGKTLTIDNAEESLGKEVFSVLKRKYHLMQIKTYIMFHTLKNECSQSSNVILFYYDSDIDSIEQGEILDRLVKEHEYNVFAIEYNYSRSIMFLEEFYNITKAPTIILNFDKKLEGLNNLTTLKNEINLTTLKNEI